MDREPFIPPFNSVKIRRLWLQPIFSFIEALGLCTAPGKQASWRKGTENRL